MKAAYFSVGVKSRLFVDIKLCNHTDRRGKSPNAQYRTLLCLECKYPQYSFLNFLTRACGYNYLGSHLFMFVVLCCT
jgi:hypothetical protein